MNLEHKCRYIHNPGLIHMVLAYNERRLVCFFFFLNKTLICKWAIFHILDSQRKFEVSIISMEQQQSRQHRNIKEKKNEKMDYQVWE